MKYRSWYSALVLLAVGICWLLLGGLAEANMETVGQSHSFLTVGFSQSWLTLGFSSAVAPTISSAMPVYGYRGDTGLSVVLAGTHFDNATVVDFGTGVTVDSFLVDSSIQITTSITVDNAAFYGYRTVSVTTSGGTGTKANGFDILSPEITSIDPNHKVVGSENVSIVLAGTHLLYASGIDFGAGITLNFWSVNSDTELGANISVSENATGGYRDITVTTTHDTITVPNGFRVDASAPATSADPIVLVLEGMIPVLVIALWMYILVKAITEGAMSTGFALGMGLAAAVILIFTVVMYAYIL